MNTTTSTNDESKQTGTGPYRLGPEGSRRVRRRPLVGTAVQWRGDNLDESAQLLGDRCRLKAISDSESTLEGLRGVTRYPDQSVVATAMVVGEWLVAADSRVIWVDQEDFARDFQDDGDHHPVGSGAPPGAGDGAAALQGARYCRVPLDVRAVQWRGDNLDEIAALLGYRPSVAGGCLVGLDAAAGYPATDEPADHCYRGEWLALLDGPIERCLVIGPVEFREDFAPASGPERPHTGLRCADTAGQ